MDNRMVFGAVMVYFVVYIVTVFEVDLVSVVDKQYQCMDSQTMVVHMMSFHRLMFVVLLVSEHKNLAQN